MLIHLYLFFVSITSWNSAYEGIFEFITTNVSVIIKYLEWRHPSRQNVITNLIERLILWAILQNMNWISSHGDINPISKCLDSIHWRLQSFDFSFLQQFLLTELIIPQECSTTSLINKSVIKKLLLKYLWFYLIYQ